MVRDHPEDCRCGECIAERMKSNGDVDHFTLFDILSSAIVGVVRGCNTIYKKYPIPVAILCALVGGIVIGSLYSYSRITHVQSQQPNGQITAQASLSDISTSGEADSDPGRMLDKLPSVPEDAHTNSSNDNREVTQSADQDPPRNYSSRPSSYNTTLPIVNAYDLLEEANRNGIAFNSKWSGRDIIVFGELTEIGTAPVRSSIFGEMEVYCLTLKAGNTIHEVECYLNYKASDDDVIHLYVGQEVYITSNVNDNSIDGEFRLCLFSCELLYPLNPSREHVSDRSDSSTQVESGVDSSQDGDSDSHSHAYDEFEYVNTDLSVIPVCELFWNAKKGKASFIDSWKEDAFVVVGELIEICTEKVVDGKGDVRETSVLSLKCGKDNQIAKCYMKLATSDEDIAELSVGQTIHVISYVNENSLDRANTIDLYNCELLIVDTAVKDSPPSTHLEDRNLKYKSAKHKYDDKSASQRYSIGQPGNYYIVTTVTKVMSSPRNTLTITSLAPGVIVEVYEIADGWARIDDDPNAESERWIRLCDIEKQPKTKRKV